MYAVVYEGLCVFECVVYTVQVCVCVFVEYRGAQYEH